MRKVILIAALFSASNTIYAQWTTNGTNIYNSNTGNVGIGTTAPAYKLDVSTSAATTLRIGTTSSTGNPNLIFKGSTGYWKINKPASAGGPNTPSSLDFTYNTEVYGGDRPAMSLYWNGSSLSSLIVGSNNTTLVTHGYVLAVDGKIGARELVISNATPFPDYVFGPNYKLLSLKEIENYIKKHSHLPEMPSAEEVKKDGLQVGKLNTILVQKVEELTLQLIEMNKRIEELEKKAG